MLLVYTAEIRHSACAPLYTVLCWFDLYVGSHSPSYLNSTQLTHPSRHFLPNFTHASAKYLKYAREDFRLRKI